MPHETLSLLCGHGLGRGTRQFGGHLRRKLCVCKLTLLIQAYDLPADDRSCSLAKPWQASGEVAAAYQSLIEYV